MILLRSTFWALILLLTTSCSAPKALLDSGHPLTSAVEAGIASGKKTFDHSSYDRLLKAHVTDTGTVDYTALAKERPTLTAYLEQVKGVDLSDYGREELLALLMNAYNALTIDWILAHQSLESGPLQSIRDTTKPWKGERHRVGGTVVSLDFIEHSLLRVPTLFNEPRVHFGVNCASKGCPPLRNEAFVGSRVRDQLEDSVTRALAMPSQLRVEGEKVLVSEIFNWFGEDFRRGESSLPEFLIPRAPAAAALILREKGSAAIGFLPYDWSLNGS